MENYLERFELLVGFDAIEKLKNARVLVFGIGGVGGYVVENLARCGIGHIDLVDKDRVDITNINRQIIATTKSVGCYKAEVMKNRILDINPRCEVRAYNLFFMPENSGEFDFRGYDYIVDAIDTVKAKIELVEKANREGVRIISAMGAGNRLNPTKFEVSDIFKTTYCPLARVMRGQLKKRGIKKLKVVYSREVPLKTNKDVIASASFCVAAMGQVMAWSVIEDLINTLDN